MLYPSKLTSSRFRFLEVGGGRGGEGRGEEGKESVSFSFQPLPPTLTFLHLCALRDFRPCDASTTRLAVLCRSCVTFVDKMDQFIRRGWGVGGGLYSESSISRQYAVLYKLRIFDSVKRCFQLSPTSHQPSKHLLVLKDRPTESFDVVGRPSQLLAHAKMPLFPIRFFFSCAR